MCDVSARAFSSVNIAIPSGGWHPVAFDQNRWDSAGLHESIDQARFTAPMDGLYEAGFSMAFKPSATGARGIRVKATIGGIDQIISVQQLPSAGADFETVLSNGGILFKLAKGDSITFDAFQSSGADLELHATSSDDGVSFYGIEAWVKCT
jgi:hypothetical protein